MYAKYHNLTEAVFGCSLTRIYFGEKSDAVYFSERQLSSETGEWVKLASRVRTRRERAVISKLSRVQAVLPSNRLPLGFSHTFGSCSLAASKFSCWVSRKDLLTVALAGLATSHSSQILAASRVHQYHRLLFHYHLKKLGQDQASNFS